MASSNEICCSLRTRTKLIAIIYLIHSGFSVFIAIASWTPADAYSETYSSSDDPWLRRTARENGFITNSETMYELLTVGLLLGLVEFVLSALLLIGAVQNNVFRCSLWFGFNIGLTALATLALVIIGIHSAVTQDFVTGALFILVVAIGAAISAYLLSVVYRYIQLLKKGEEGEGEEPEPPIVIEIHDAV